MATPAKKREVDDKMQDSGKIKNNDDSHDDNDDNFDDEQGTKIRVDFIGCTPEHSDYHGIKILLQQLFLKAHISVQALAEYVIKHNYVGSVVKQVAEIEDDENDANNIYGVTSIINISHGQNEDCIQQLRNLLQELASDYATDSTNGMIKSILENDSAALGLIINERFVNIPADISVPLFETLVFDMKRANSRGMPYDFQYYVLISKLYKPKITNTSSKTKGSEDPEIFWCNQEEEALDMLALCKFEFSVENESDTAMTGRWCEEDDEMIPYRRVIVFEASKLPPMVYQIRKFISN